MRLPRCTSLYWRLLISYLLVIGVGSATLYGTGEIFGRFFAQRHLESMGLTFHNLPPESDRMLADLREAYRRAFSRSLFWGSLTSVLIAGGVSLFVTKQIVSPIKRIQRASRRIAAGRYGERRDVSAPGEIGELANSFDAMISALNDAEARRVELLGNIAHEFRTPLSSLRGNLEGLQDGLFTLEDETLEVGLREVARLERLVADLSLLAHTEAGQGTVKPERVSLEAICSQTIAALRPLFVAKGVGLRCIPIPPDLMVMVDPHRTAQVLANLLTNALRHTPSGGEVVLWAEVTDSQRVTMYVQDTGEGIPEEVLPHIFTRFYRSDPARRAREGSGSGVGLTIAKHFVEAQGGQIGAENRAGEGSRFWFSLPRVS
jgi:signal transduction histidine kinase